MLVFANLNAEFTKNNLTRRFIADKLHINENTLRNKILGKQEFKLSEIQIILELLPGKTIDYLFSKDKIKQRNKKEN